MCVSAVEVEADPRAVQERVRLTLTCRLFLKTCTSIIYYHSVFSETASGIADNL